MKKQGSMQRKRRSRRRKVLIWTLILVLPVSALFYIGNMPGRSYSGPFNPLSEHETVLRDRLKQHIIMLADTIGERNIWQYNELEAAADYIRKTLADIGYEVLIQEFETHEVKVKNIEVELKGTSLPDEIIVIGAHYDSVVGSPGANDNGSGVAGVLEIARHFAAQKPARTVRFVAFVNEEPPFFQTGEMGSRVYASRSRNRGEQIIAMFSLETIGYYSDMKGSQHYPFPLNILYPSTGDFIGFVGNISSRKLMREVIASFRGHTSFPSESAVAPEWLTGIGWSDHWSFWQEGYPAIMITDTALFRYHHYHDADDTPGKIKYDHLARVVAGITRVVTEIAGTGH